MSKISTDTRLDSAVRIMDRMLSAKGRSDAEPKVHLVLRGNALCDFQSRGGGRLAAHSVKEFEAVPPGEQCKECARKLKRLQQTRRSDAARYPVKLEIELSQWESLSQLIEFLKYVRSSANGGHSFEIGADVDADGPGQMFGKQRCGSVVYVDGDGSDKIGRMWLNGEEIE